MPKDPDKVALGRKGGLARAKNLSAAERSAIARKAVAATKRVINKRGKT